jgi:cyclohexanone monooxygenase
VASTQISAEAGSSTKKRDNLEVDFDVIVVGAGFAGLGLIHYLREIGCSLRVFDKADDVGGTWCWNRYPGARTDSESYYYCLTFSEEMLKEWSWSERYPGWEETLHYLQYVADKGDMRKDIQLETSVTSAEFDETTGQWVVRTDRGEELRCKYFISAMGLISEPYVPGIKGLDRFQGPCFHSSRWPRDLDYKGKRVGIIGAGATAVQILPEIAPDVESVTLFQRTPNHILPARQKPMTAEWEKEIKENYEEILQKCRTHVFGMPFDSPVDRLAVDTPEAERERIFEALWQEGGFRFCFESFDDLLGDLDANEAAAKFIRGKIAEIVEDPQTATLLTPTTYPLFAKRPPLDHGYYEAFNRSNVHLVDIAETEPLVEITDKGVRTTRAEYEFDILVLATGFDALTGALDRLDIRGRDAVTLKEKWQAGPNTFMGVCVHGFPNFFMITGPQAPFANLPTTIEQNIQWITRCIQQMEQTDSATAEPTEQAQTAWGEHAKEVIEQTVMKYGDAANTWFLGSNIPGKGPQILIYFGGAQNYFDLLDESAENGFPQLEFAPAGGT